MRQAVETATAAACDAAADLGSRRAACTAVGIPQAPWYRAHRQTPPRPRPERAPRPQPRALTLPERAAVTALLHDPGHVDQAPATVQAELLDQGTYLCSVSSMYRILRAADEVHERRRQAMHPATVKPELVAAAPGRVWSWDIERHEALANRAVVQDHCPGPRRSGAGKLRAARVQGRGSGWQAALTTPEWISTVRWSDVRQARREGVREEPATERPSR